jgi:hypothetical protein
MSGVGALSITPQSVSAEYALTERLVERLDRPDSECQWGGGVLGIGTRWTVSRRSPGYQLTNSLVAAIIVVLVSPSFVTGRAMLGGLDGSCQRTTEWRPGGSYRLCLRRPQK